MDKAFFFFFIVDGSLLRYFNELLLFPNWSEGGLLGKTCVDGNGPSIIYTEEEETGIADWWVSWMLFSVLISLNKSITELIIVFVLFWKTFETSCFINNTESYVITKVINFAVVNERELDIDTSSLWPHRILMIVMVKLLIISNVQDCCKNSSNRVFIKWVFWKVRKLAKSI